MTKIDFDEANHVIYKMNELRESCDKTASHCNSIDASSVSSFSPSTVSTHAEIQNTIRNLSNNISIYCSNFLECITKYWIFYERIRENINSIFNLSKMQEYETNDYYIIGPTEDGAMLRVMIKGKICLIANSRINCIDYAKYITANGQYQKDLGIAKFGGLAPSQCQGLCLYYVRDMLRGTFTSYNSMNKDRDPSGKACWNQKFVECKDIKVPDNDSLEAQEIYNYIYEELKAGRPVALQVSQSESDKRHWVVITGFDETVTCAKDLSPETMVALDCFDGNLDMLSNCGSQEGGRTLYSDGNLQVIGASDYFLETQANNEEWLEKYSESYTTILNKGEKLDEETLKRI